MVTSMDAQTWAAPQTSHYLRGDKFEKPMGKIVQARAQVKLSGYPSGNSRPTPTSRCRLMKNSLSLVFALGQISKTKMGYAFDHFEDQTGKISRGITTSSIPVMDRFRAPQREWV